MKKWQQTFFELLFEILFEHSLEGIAIVDPESRVVQANSVFCSMFGYAMDEIAGKDLDKLVASDESIREEASKITHSAHEGRRIVMETRRQRKDGSMFDVAMSIVPIISEGEIAAVYGIYRDITDRKKAEVETERQKTYFENLFRSSPFAIALIRENAKILRVNARFEDLFGYGEAECVDRTLDELIVPPEGREDAEALTAKSISGVAVNEEGIRIHRGGTRMLCSIRAVRFQVPGESPLIYGIYEDITERRRAEEHIRFLGFRDGLTGLYNRSFLEEELDRLDTARQLPMSIIAADIDNLKLVNDIFGHDEGDALLRRVADILRICCRKEDIVTRLGGDEFMVLLPGTGLEQAEEICSRIRGMIPDGAGKIVPPSLSMGVAVRTELTQDMGAVRKKADENMYLDKLSRRTEARAAVFSRVNENLALHGSRKEHVRDLLSLSVDFARFLGLDRNESERLRRLAEYHDVGFAAIPLEIIEKNGPLSEEERETIRKHPEKGFHISRNIPEISSVSEEILSHHERFDGKGYPRGLEGDKIPKLARIFSVMDAFDIMTKRRRYKPLLSTDEALDKITANAGNRFDPYFAGLFIDMVRSGNVV
ncbi:MAG: hypothetical protein STSR0007_08240 [Thermovirga sp.]